MRFVTEPDLFKRTYGCLVSPNPCFAIAAVEGFGGVPDAVPNRIYRPGVATGTIFSKIDTYGAVWNRTGLEKENSKIQKIQRFI